MTVQQKEQIERLRNEGYGCKRIAELLDISANTVKSYCKRNALMGSKEVSPSQDVEEHFCKCCGLPVRQNPGRKEKKFCSDACRMKWWNSHLDLVKRKAVHEFECAYCHHPFLAYAQKQRKYCSHQCYVFDRFGGDGDE